MPAGVEYVLGVINQVVSAVDGKVILSRIMHSVRHDVPGVLANDCAFGDPYNCAKAYSSVV